MASKEEQSTTKHTKSTVAASTGFRRSSLGQGAATGVRLPSFKKRDLTLGGTTKKTFTPTIPAQRVKRENVSAGVVKKEPLSPQPTPRGKEKQQKEGWSGKEREKGRGRGRGRGREIITSSSVFSMGPAARKGAGGGVPTARGVGRGALSPSSSIGGAGRANVGGIKLSPSGAVEMSAFQVPAEHMDVDGSDSDSELFAYSAYPPVQLPLDYSLHQKKHRIVTANVKVVRSDTKVELPDVKPVTPDTKAVIPDTSLAERKSGDTLSTDATSKSGNKSHPTLVTSSNMQPSSLSASEVTAAEVFSHLDDPQAHMVLLQLPDTLPFTPGDQMEEGGEGAEETNNEEKLVSLSASQQSGYVGKLKVHKSGKVKLHLGNTVLDVSMGTPCSFRQDVVSMDTTEGNLIHLGVLSHKFVCIPDFEHLLSDVAPGSSESVQ